MFRHPKYYKELRKRNKLDQAISGDAHDGERERAPGPVYYACVILYNILDVSTF